MKNLSSLKVIQNYLSKIGGVQAIKLVEIIEKKQKPLKDEEIAKHINSKVTEVRALLNKLNYRGITYYDKRKDQNSGWYHYTWKINEKRMVELLVEEQKKILKKLEERKRLRENYSIFSCMDECIEEPFEVAIEYNFKCPACGNEMKYIEFNKQVKKLEKEIGKIKVALDGLTII